jgi:predicted nuclease of restriction endonuclease-like (RecB) superfamily
VVAYREVEFDQVAALIQAAKRRAYQAVDATLVGLYWQIGQFISQKIESSEWGDGVVDELALYLARTEPGRRGFTRRNLFRMRQFYVAYRSDEIVSPLVTQLPWSHHLLILSNCKNSEQRAFYIRTAIQERWSKRELERQQNLQLFERVVTSPVKMSPLAQQRHGTAASIFRDSYSVEFLKLPANHAEGDLHRGLVENLKAFLIELGRDFCFVGSEYPIQVGGRDFALDLLFFHRGLNCLVAIELKAERFEPEHLGKLNFYLEALDRDARKPHENPAIGVLLCATKDTEVVEYALRRSLSPALIAQYETHLPDKVLLRTRLQEFYSARSDAAIVPVRDRRRLVGKALVRKAPERRQRKQKSKARNRQARGKTRLN